MTIYKINTYEFKPGTEQADSYIVTIDGMDGPLFDTFADAQAWIEADKGRYYDPIANEPDNGDRFY